MCLLWPGLYLVNAKGIAYEESSPALNPLEWNKKDLTRRSNVPVSDFEITDRCHKTKYKNNRKRRMFQKYNMT